MGSMAFLSLLSAWASWNVTAFLLPYPRIRSKAFLVRNVSVPRANGMATVEAETALCGVAARRVACSSLHRWRWSVRGASGYGRASIPRLLKAGIILTVHQ